MAEPLVVKKLETIDRELHSLIYRLKIVKPRKSLSLAKLNKLMEKDRILDVGTTSLIREMRDKEYKL